jgi:hypothetical protein
VNGITMTFDYDKTEKNLFISPEEAMRLLREGVIDKNDFKGDVTKIIGEGTIANKAVFNIKEMRIGKNTVKDLEATVNNKIKATLIFGEGILSKFGEFTIDDTTAR